MRAEFIRFISLNPFCSFLTAVVIGDFLKLFAKCLGRKHYVASLIPIAVLAIGVALMLFLRLDFLSTWVDKNELLYVIGLAAWIGIAEAMDRTMRKANRRQVLGEAPLSRERKKRSV